MKRFFKSGAKGFTLIELMTSITIMGILMALAITAYQNARKSARDGKRKADLQSISSALEMYKADNGCYPCGEATDCPTGCDTPFGDSGQGPLTNSDDGTSCNATDLEDILDTGGYMNSVPADPLGGGCSGIVGDIEFGYMYYFNTAGQDYCLYAHLENPPVDNGCSGCNNTPINNNDKNYCVKNP